MKINVNVTWDCRGLMACSGRADRICTSIVIYNEISGVSVAVQLLPFITKCVLLYGNLSAVNLQLGVLF